MVWDIPNGMDLAELPVEEGELAHIAGEGPFYHGPPRLRTALANDYLGPVSQMLDQFGAENVWRTAKQFGITSLAEAPTGRAALLELLQSEVTLLEAAQAYGVFANQGILTGQPVPAGENGSRSLTPFSVLRVENVQGEVLLEAPTSQALPILSSQLAYLVTHMLSDETARWPSLGHPNPLEIGRPAGAKLGATLQGQDAWAIGYIPQLLGKDARVF